MKKKEKILVAMSGGVDSSATASLLLEQGYDIIGATLDFEIGCSALAIKDAKIIADKLGIEHHIIHCKQAFQKNVIDYFADTYAKGATPNPCAKCNRTIKFAELIKKMKEVGADYIATGHFAKLVNNKGIYELHQGGDDTKDQSYFLSFLKYEYLQYIKFPLETITKKEVRKYAEKLGLHVANKSSSQDACFVDRDYKGFLERTNPKANIKGDIIHVNGKKLGEHKGIINYTIGQRRGLGIGYIESLFVVKLDAEKNIVYVGSNEDLYSSEVDLYDLNLLDLSVESGKEYKFKVKFRSGHKGDLAKVIFDIKNARAKVVLNEPSRAIAKGQLCAFYDGTRVVGSGWIE